MRLSIAEGRLGELPWEMLGPWRGSQVAQPDKIEGAYVTRAPLFLLVFLLGVEILSVLCELLLIDRVRFWRFLCPKV